MDPLVYPGAPERCNMQDDNCDGMFDNGALVTFFEDSDRDGHGSMAPGRRTLMACVAPMGFAAVADDCDDGDVRRFPGNVDVCDSVDNDCNGVVDQAASADLACSRPRALSTCAMGRCGALVCDNAYSDCNGLNMDGCEINTRTNLNCNACGANCSRPNAVTECGSGACRISECSPGFSDCDGNEANGCETATNSVNNCGRCNVVCPMGATCLAMGGGFTCGCPGVAGVVCGGRCVDTTTDRNNCGACGNTCVVGANCQNVAGLGTCVCPMASPTICAGRCTNTAIDRSHCGGCGRVCAGVCSNGVCVHATTVDAGRFHACMMLNDASHSIRCWGYGGSVGDGTAGSRLVQTPINVRWSTMMPPRIPIELRAGPSADVTVVRVGVAGMPDEIWYWGNQTHPLGPITTEYSPVQSMVLGGPLDAIDHGGVHACFLRNGGVLCFGNNSYSQCGQLMPANIANPTVVAGLNSVRSLHAAALGTSVMRNNGTGYVWGLYPGPTPQLVAMPGRIIEDIVINQRAGRVVAVTSDGVVAMSEAVFHNDASFCSGGCTGQQPVPLPLGVGELASTQVAINEQAVCVVLREPMAGAGGEVRCRGRNTSGELGDGTNTVSLNAWRTVRTGPGTSLRGVQQISAGGFFFCTTTVSGAVYCWGDNNWGQLGDGTAINRNYATPILWP